MFLKAFEDKQPIAYKTLFQSLERRKLSHAYIIETNDYIEADDFIKAFTKDIFCMDIDDNAHINRISSQVDNDEYTELKRIKTSTLVIKKDQILKLQSELMNKAMNGDKRVYIIEEANKLNDSSANTILKFLEEPEDNIYAILVVNNRYSLMNTILSRCQLISLNDINKKNIIDFIDLSEDIDKKVFLDNVLNFISFYEKNRKKTLLFEKREYLNYFNNREKIKNSLELMKLFYLDVLKYKTNCDVEYFYEFEDLLKIVSKNNEIENILKKIDVIINSIDRLFYYVNQNMLLDFFIIETCR